MQAKGGSMLALARFKGDSHVWVRYPGEYARRPVYSHPATDGFLSFARKGTEPGLPEQPVRSGEARCVVIDLSQVT